MSGDDRGAAGAFPFFYLFLFFAALGAFFRILFPGIPGLFLTSWTSGLVFSILFLVRRRGRRAFELSRAARPAKKTLWFAAALAAAVLAGSVSKLPVMNVAGPKDATLSPGTLEILAGLPGEVLLRANASAASGSSGPVGHLLDSYAKSSPKIKTEVVFAEGKSETTETGTGTSEPDTATVIFGDRSETVYPITENSVNGALFRLTSPPKLVLNLMGEGERSVLDEGPRGMANLAGRAREKNVFLRDHPFDEKALPRGADALMVAGPLMPLSPEKEKLLLDYANAGGKLFLLADPLVATFSEDFLNAFGLYLPDGVVIDRDKSWAGTDDTFVISTDFPGHPITRGLRDPIVWPVSGAVRAKIPPVRDGGGEEKDEEIIGTAGGAGAGIGIGIESGIGTASGTMTETVSADGTTDGTEAAPETGSAPGTNFPVLAGHTDALALSGPASWLETDKLSLRDKLVRYEEGKDPPGPLVLASATTLVSGGKMVLAADSDLASNSRSNFAGNMSFLERSLFWLLDLEPTLAGTRQGSVLQVTDFVARLFFWLPVIFWPLFALIGWLAFRAKRRGSG
ncbi:MAG: GldG family protein [Deltaproteobacteria bacterium]|jgi:hypothetical protein|nr:GldG family protein [Deltaproteobacteria bacterium]